MFLQELQLFGEWNSRWKKKKIASFFLNSIMESGRKFRDNRVCMRAGLKGKNFMLQKLNLLCIQSHTEM